MEDECGRGVNLWCGSATGKFFVSIRRASKFECLSEGKHTDLNAAFNAHLQCSSSMFIFYVHPSLLVITHYTESVILMVYINLAISIRLRIFLIVSLSPGVLFAARFLIMMLAAGVVV